MGQKELLNKQKVIVVGNGMVGHHFIDQLNKTNTNEYSIATFSEESRLAYNRVMLTSYFAGSSADDLALTTPQGYDEQGVEYYVNEEVISIERDFKKLTTASGKVLSYDKLVLATGSFPFVPPVPGKDQDHIHVYRTLNDLDAIENSSESSQVGVVIGGGLLGLEAANAIKQLGLETHVVEFAPRLMAVQLDQEGGDLLREKITALNVTVHTEKNTTEIVKGDNSRYRMNFADGSFLETDIIVFSAGIRPQDKLARQSGLTIGERGGIVVNDHCLTSDPSIYAIGECALWNNKIFGLVAPGYAMAKVAVSHLKNSDKQEELHRFTGADMSTKLKLLGVEVGSIGDAHGNTPDSQSYSFIDSVSGTYKKIVVSSNGKTLLGAVLVGDTSDYSKWLPLVLNKIELLEPPEHLLLPEIDGVKESSVEFLPDNAQICACYDVPKSALSNAVENGAQDIAAIKSCTNAGTGCGGCVPLVTEVLNCELEKLAINAGSKSSSSTYKDDTCFIFPRIPDGDITPEHLIYIGEIAKEYNLFTKISGAQRIDLLGAQRHQLPMIKQKMADVGLATEHLVGDNQPAINPE
jgi:nitrite reductase (NADH) large subunit